MKRVYLKSLTLKGFKSFAEPTTLIFEPGLCAVVGPNGSGKSNVVDALAWVMGEQGAKSLRGATMGDVIFAGAGSHKPLGRAEVTLTIDNTDGALPIDYTEVSVTRRMFRDGGSDYEINGAKARLTDVQELLGDAGIGREMHVIVGQGKITEILESKPDERRTYIEEAAGIVNHRRRKEKAERKLVAMQANLDRLRDLTEELHKQLGPLSRQAKAAERAHSVQAIVREKRLIIAGWELTHLKEAVEHAAAEAAAAADAEQAARAAEAAARDRESALAAEVSAMQPATEAANALWFRLSSLIERVGAVQRIAGDRMSGFTDTAYTGPDPTATHARWERAVAEHDEAARAASEAAQIAEEQQVLLESAQQAAAEAQSHHLAQVRAVADQRAEAARISAEREAADRAVERATAHVEEQRDAVAAARTALDTATAEVDTLTDGDSSEATALDGDLAAAEARAAAELTDATARLTELRTQLRDQDATVAGLTARIEALTATQPAPAAQLPDDLTALASVLTVNSGDERAVAAALGALAEAQVAENTLEHLLATFTGPGHTDSFPRTTIVAAQSGEPWTLDVALPAGCRWLINSVTAPQVTVALTRLLAGYVLADTVDHALRAVRSDPRVTAVTPDGVLIGENWMTIGQASTTPVETAALIRQAEGELAAATTARDEFLARLDGAHTAVDRARQAHAAAHTELVEYTAVQGARQRDIDRARRNLATFQRHLDTAVQRLTAAETDLAEAEAARDGAAQRIKQADASPLEEPSTTARDAAALRLEDIRQAEITARMSATAAAEQERRTGEIAAALARRERRERADYEAFVRTQEKKRQAAAVAADVAAAARVVAARLEEAVEEARRERETTAALARTRAEELAAVRTHLQELRRSVDDSQAAAHQAQVTDAQARVRLEEAEKKATGELVLPAETIRSEFADRDGDTFDIDTAREELAQAERRLTALGKVNPLAVEEYRALEERYNFLVTQVEDVEAARRDLRAVISEVDETMRRLFTEAFRDVATVFPEVFSTLFPGGEGRLSLADPNDPMGSGIHVYARPAGKRVSRLSLLSGGEKTLTALAMLVAIFRARPSPFYVFDEVEAALDDVNLRRLLALFDALRDNSQLIVITHQKPTMDRANVIYGVTMRGDGVTRVLSQRMDRDGG
ncbi:MAG: chromosome segregation protein SMC [Corynebacterium sp.]|nr:chromosome segregation protein SMC [Corynebacterium sp.]